MFVPSERRRVVVPQTLSAAVWRRSTSPAAEMESAAKLAGSVKVAIRLVTAASTRESPSAVAS
jgi:hypothetical protein